MAAFSLPHFPIPFPSIRIILFRIQCSLNDLITLARYLKPGFDDCCSRQRWKFPGNDGLREDDSKEVVDEGERMGAFGNHCSAMIWV